MKLLFTSEATGEENIFQGAKIISLAPFISKLSSKKIIPNGLFLNKAAQYEIVNSSYRISSLIEKHINENKKFLKFIESSEVCFWTYVDLNFILTQLTVIDSAIKKFSPSSIEIRISKNFDKVNHFGNNLRKDYSSFFTFVVQQYVESKRLDIKVVNIHRKSSLSNWKIIVLKFKKILSYFLTSQLNNFLFLAYKISFKVSKKKYEPILICDDSYNMESVVEKARAKFDFLPIYLSRSKLRSSLKNILQFREMSFIYEELDHKIYNDVKEEVDLFFEDLFKRNNNKICFLNINLENIIRKFMIEKIYLKLSSLLYFKKKISKVIRTFEPKLSFAQYSISKGLALARASKEGKTKSILISHGSLPASQEKIVKKAWKFHTVGLVSGDFDYNALQTPYAKSYFDSNEISSKPTISGPVLFSIPELKNNKIQKKKDLFGINSIEKKIILHASTPKPRNLRPITFESIEEYISNINLLISACAKIKNIILVIRFRPSPELNFQQFKSQLNESSNCLIRTSGTFSDYLSVSDLLVSYSSTTIEEALNSKIPVLQIDQLGKYIHVPTDNKMDPAFDNPVFYCNKKNELTELIKNILKNSKTIIENTNWEKFNYNFDKDLKWLREIIDDQNIKISNLHF